MTSARNASKDPRYGFFSGPIVAEFLVEDGEDYRVKLLEPITFTDIQLPGEPEVTAPPGLVIDGASIPSFAWPMVGAPLTGDFRRAAAIHDYECRMQSIRSTLVHERFYRAMRADGVGWFRARLMFLAVRYFGPQF